MQKPLVSIIMAVYNGDRFLQRAIGSILIQEYTHFELIIIDDGSTDKTWKIANSFTDKRIKTIRLSRNGGIANASNKGLSIAKGTYIARMDSDDMSMPARIKEQVTYLEKNSTVDVVGTGYGVITESNEFKNVGGVIVDHEDIYIDLLFRYSFINGSLMFRKSVFTKSKVMYPKNARYNEDYSLMLSLRKIAKFHNIPKVLYIWRVNTKGITATYFEKMNKGVKDLIQYQRQTTSLPDQSHENISQKLSTYTSSVESFNGLHYKAALTSNYQYFLFKKALLYASEGHFGYFLKCLFWCVTTDLLGFINLIITHISFILIGKNLFKT